MITANRAHALLRLISQAWGPDDNEGYCFFPWVEGPNRNFRTKSFHWPTQRDDIVDHMIAHEGDDLYWCPLLFSEDARRVEYATEEYALWADLDESDPNKIPAEWEPSVVWETSPGRYQALWLLQDPEEEDLYGASRKGADNQRMTRMVDADPSGWDTTQLLRIPTWINHKPQYEVAGEFPKGKLLKKDGPRYTGSDFNSLPAIVDEDEEDLPIDADLFEQIDGVVPGEVLERVKHMLPKGVAGQIERGPQDGEERSKRMYYFMRCLADVGCSVQEIVAVIRPTQWNKFKGRKTELEELAKQATTAWGKRKKQPDEFSAYVVKDINDLVREAKKPSWLIHNLLTKGSVGFIGGEPKSRKSWVALDLAISVAAAHTGHNPVFLDKFRVVESGPVLYFILEDSDYLVADRIKQIWASKTKYDSSYTELVDGKAFWVQQNGAMDIRLNFIYGQHVDLFNADSMALVHRVIREGYSLPDGRSIPYALVLVDTFMRSMGGVDINSAGDTMNTILAPLSRLVKRTGTNLMLVHHYNKSKAEEDTRGGTRLLGSQALHAWAEDSLYLSAREHGFKLEVESKVAPTDHWEFTTDPTQRTWSPRHTLDVGAQVHEVDFTAVEHPKPRSNSKTLTALQSLGPGLHTTKEVAAAGGPTWSPGFTHRGLKALADRGVIVKEGTQWRLP